MEAKQHASREQVHQMVAMKPEASAAEIVAALSRQGLLASPELVEQVKRQSDSEQSDTGAGQTEAGGKPHKATGASSSSGATEGVAQAVRQYLLSHPDATAAEIVDALAKQGVELPVGLAASLRIDFKMDKYAVRSEPADDSSGDKNSS